MQKRIDLPIRVFVDRLKEYNRLRSLFLSDAAGETIITVQGNVGVGKTRLVQEVLKVNERRDIIWGDCSYLADYIAYYVVRELVKYRLQSQGSDILQGIPPSIRRIVGKIVPEVADEGVEPAPGRVAIDNKFAFYEGVREILEWGGRAKIIVVDSCQWIDRSSTDFLRFILRAERKQPATFVFLYRTDEETEVLKKFLGAVRKIGDIVDIVIEPFSENEVRAILTSVIGEQPDEHFLRYVFQWSGGNPFFLEEITSALVLDGHLVLERGQWIFHEPVTGTVPRTIAEIATAKYLGLSDDARRVLDAASVIGWFDIQVLQDLVDMKPVRIVELIEEIDTIGMIRYTEERIEFSDEISRNAVYEQVARTQDIKAIHRDVGRLIKQQSRANERAVIHELAYHYYHGRDRDKGARFCVSAGDNARENYAHNEAIRYYSWALELLGEEDRREKNQLVIDCLRKRIDAYRTVGEFEHALDDIRHACALIQKIRDTNGEMEMWYTLAFTYFQMSRIRDAARETDRLFELAGQHDDHLWQARGCMLAAGIRKHLADYSKALEFYDEAFAYFKRVGDQAHMSRIKAHLSALYRDLGDIGKACEAVEQGQSLAEISGDKQSIASCAIAGGNLHHILGRFDQALTAYQEACRLFRDIGYRQGEAIACASISNAQVSLGQYRKGLQSLQEGINIAREIGDRLAEAGDHANLGTIYMNLGEYPRAVNAYEDALRIAREIESAPLEVFALDHLGSVYLYCGNYAYAESLHKEAHALIRQRRLGIRAFYNIFFRGRLCLAQGKAAEAKNLIDEARESAGRNGAGTMIVDAALLLGEYYLEQEDRKLFSQHMKTLTDRTTYPFKKSSDACQDLLWGRFHMAERDYPAAEKALRSALKMFEELEEQYNVGQAYAYLGIMEGSRSQGKEAHAYLVTARGIFEAIGARAWKQKIKGILDAEAPPV